MVGGSHGTMPKQLSFPEKKEGVTVELDSVIIHPRHLLNNEPQLQCEKLQAYCHGAYPVSSDVFVSVQIHEGLWLRAPSHLTSW